MPDPTRPVAGAPIDTDWGQRVHDATFTPNGCRVSGGSASTVGTSFVQLQINTADDDPGGWLASDHLTVPAGEGGLYQWALRVTTDNGDVGQFTRLQVRVNGIAIADLTEENEGSTAVFMTLGGLEDMAAGDVVTVWARKSGGTSPSVLIKTLTFIRMGSAFGA